MIDVRKLRMLAALQRLGTIATVAAELHLSPPGVSMQLAALEREFGVQLTERQGRRVVLTPAGVVLAAHGREIADRVSPAEVDLDALDRRRRLARDPRQGACPRAPPLDSRAGGGPRGPCRRGMTGRSLAIAAALGMMLLPGSQLAQSADTLAPAAGHAPSSGPSRLGGTVPAELEHIPDGDEEPADRPGTLEALTCTTYESFTYAQRSQELTKTAWVYLPSGYSDAQRSNVFCLSHGGWSDETTLMGTPDQPTAFKHIIDNAIAGGRIAPSIMVMPTSNNIHPDRTIAIVNHLHERAAAGEQVFHDIHDEDGKRSDPPRTTTACSSSGPRAHRRRHHVPGAPRRRARRSGDGISRR